MMIELAMAFLLGAIVGFALKFWLSEDDLLSCMLDDYTPLVRWWHRRFGHGRGYPCAGICWACGQVKLLERVADVLTTEILDGMLRESRDAGAHPPQRERVLIDPDKLEAP